MSPTDFYAATLAYCAAMDASMTSGKRSNLHNATVGGVTGSAHRFGLAFDLVYDRTVLPADELRVAMASRLGLRLIVEGDHDHVQPMDWPKG